MTNTISARRRFAAAVWTWVCCGCGSWLRLLFRLPLVRVVMVLSVVNLGISLRLLGTLLLFCHRQGMAPALVCGSALHWGLLWVQLIAALALLLCSLGRQFPRRVSKASP